MNAFMDVITSFENGQWTQGKRQWSEIELHNRNLRDFSDYCKMKEYDCKQIIKWVLTLAQA